MRVTEPSFRSVTVDSRFTPLTHLLQHIEGASWSVNYYSQVLTGDSELSPQQLDLAAVHQQYVLIELLELKVSAGLEGTQDNETKEHLYTGTALVYPGAGVIPNLYDMFLADMGDGRQGVFVVTHAEKKNYLQEACYEITYTLKSYDGASLLADLERKTIKRARFVKEFIHFGQNPQVLSSDYTQLIDFRQRYKELLGLYLADFFSIEEQTLLIPDQPEPTYDPFLTRALLDWVGTNEHPYVQRIRLPNVDGDKAMSAPTLWDSLVMMNDGMLPLAVQKMRLIDRSQWRNAPQYGGVYFTGIQRVVYPTEARTDVDTRYDHQCAPLGGEALVSGGQRFTDLVRLLPYTALEGIDGDETQPPTLPNIVPVTQDAFYVFTEGFYKTTPEPASQLERLVLSTLRQEAIDKVVLGKLAQQASVWENLERFYYIPVVLAILKASIRTN